MSFNLVSQYKFSTTEIIVKVQGTIDAMFIQEFVGEYKALLKEKVKKGNDFASEERLLKFVILMDTVGEDEDFDLLFLSYLVLMKEDFPNINIQFDLNKFPETAAANAYLFKLVQHRVHLLITCKREIFKIFKMGVEFTHEKIAQSTSYIPPIFVNPDTILDLFEKRNHSTSYKNILLSLIRENKSKFGTVSSQKESFQSILQDLFIESVGIVGQWDSGKLSTLYFIRALSELSVLRYSVNSYLNSKSTHQIGNTIRITSDDKQSNKSFWEGVTSVLEVNGVYNFSNIESFIFSLVIQNSELFKIPSSIQKMYNQIEKFFTEQEKNKIKRAGEKNADKYIKAKFIELYISNLRRIIIYTKDISYGLHELAKNIVEHSGQEKSSGYGMLTARIYSLDKIKILKDTVPEWLKNYGVKHKFMDINVIDTGLNSVIDSYENTIKNEIITLKSIDPSISHELIDAYKKDLREMGNYRLNNLFNFDSIKLLHQVNRTKARLGLLIFSQTVLYEKKAFVSLASNSIYTDDSVGFHLYKKGKEITNITTTNLLALGTNYNFIIPIKELFEKDSDIKTPENHKSGASSSVYKELHAYIDNSKLRKLHLEMDYTGMDKYSKIEKLRMECNLLVANEEILLIDAGDLSEVLQNSSDWVRFLANMQFTTESMRDIIIYNFNVDLYLELLNILKIFDQLDIENKGFWSEQRYVLFFIPIQNYDGGTFWFNSLLWSTNYSMFRRINNDIGLYHENLSKMAIDNDKYPPVDYNQINSSLFSTSKKLLNFELVIKNSKGETLYEETLRSLVNIEINDNANEDQ